MRASTRGVSLIKEFEGFPNNGCPYRDPIGVWTRGYGRIEGIGPGSPCISEPAAVHELKHLLATSYEPAVKQRRFKQLTRYQDQNRYDAVVSAVYNLGPGVLDAGRSLGDALRSRNNQAAADAFLLYDKAGGRALPGLTRRRKAERALFLEPVPVKFTDAELKLLRRKLTPATRLALKAQARRIQLAARLTRDGWTRNDRERRFQGMRKRALTK